MSNNEKDEEGAKTTRLASEGTTRLAPPAKGPGVETTRLDREPTVPSDVRPVPPTGAAETTRLDREPTIPLDPSLYRSTKPAPAGATTRLGAEATSLLGSPRPKPGERTAILRRTATRGFAGLLVLALLGALEIARRGAEAPDAVPTSSSPEEPPLEPAPTLAPFAPPAVDGAPAIPEATPVSHLEIEFAHGLKSGLLTVFVDDQRVLQLPLRARVTGRVLTVERRHSVVRRTIDVPPGERRVRVEVSLGDKPRSETIAGAFREGGTRRLEVGLGMFRSLWLEWK